MITRKSLDKLLPDTAETRQLAERLSGLDLSQDILDRSLKWLADFVDNDRWPRPAWKSPDNEDYDPSVGAWQITMRGLEYKERMSYLTAEGWPSGEPCWYVCVECGWREFVGAETPELAVIRAIIIVKMTARSREVAPKKRPLLIDMVEAESGQSYAQP